MAIDLNKYHKRLEKIDTLVFSGKVTKVIGTVIEGDGPRVGVGSVCRILPRDEYGVEQSPVEAEVVGFSDDRVLLMPLESSAGIVPGSRIIKANANPTVLVSPDMMGRVFDGLGRPLDGGPPIVCGEEFPIEGRPINPVKRSRIFEPLDVGVRAINGLLTMGKGQKMGIFAGSGVGKSVLLGMMARYTTADVNVIALIGERGREVREFLEGNLGPEGLAKSVVFVATSDMSPLARIRGALMALATAEYFRSQGKDVLFLMDSLTRFAMARREVGLAVGEPPTTKGYTPSVFALLPSMLERLGNNEGRGGITGAFTVLVEADDMNDPIGDAARSILDGHIVLSRDLAAKNHYPAINILESASRIMSDVTSEEHRAGAGLLRQTLAVYKEAEDLINIGAYAKGSNPEIDFSIDAIGFINKYLKQGLSEQTNYSESVEGLINMFQDLAQPE
jgi:flagellum-specific ATP synthase